MNSKGYGIIGILLLSACGEPPSYDKEPHIEFLSLSRNEIDQLDSVSIEFSFTDGDGDLGFETPDTESCNLCDSSCYEHPTFSLFLTDDRTNCLTLFNIPYIPPKGSSDGISGKVSFVKSSICCISPNFEVCIPMPSYPYDTIKYSVRIKDRAGNLSNIIHIPPIVVRCN